MDKLTRYSQIIQHLLADYATNQGSIMPTVQMQTLIDTNQHHYQLLRMGWHNNRFIHTIIFHFDIINNKVWVQQNNADVLIADELIERGIAQSDIVLGFLSEKARQQSNYAVA